MDTKTFDLDQVLINFSDSEGRSAFDLRQACEGVSIMGSNGSGKSSGSARLFANKYIRAGMGGLVLTVKADEKDAWVGYMREAGRLDDLLIVEPGGKYQFDFLGYEAAQAEGRAISDNLAQIINTVVASGEDKSGNSSDPFWQDSMNMLVVHVIDLCLLAYDKVSVQMLYDIALTVPKRGQQPEEKPRAGSFGHAFQTATNKVQKQAMEFAKRLPDDEKAKLLKDNYAYDKLVIENIPDAALFRSLDQFFNDHYKSLAEKTRSIIEFSFVGLLFRLLREPIASLFCRKSNLSPEACFDGKVILLNVPTKIYDKTGRDIQIAFKYIWQRAMERRTITDNSRPVFLFADEAQTFLHPHDVTYQATARSSRICTVYITQNLSSYHSAMGGYRSEHKVASFIGTLGTKIFHSNSDVQTNTYASDLIGSAYIQDQTRSTTVAGQFSVTHGESYRLEKMVRPEEFNMMRTGGPRNNYLVEGIMHRQGNPFHDGLSFKKITFKQI